LIVNDHANLNPALYTPLAAFMLLGRNELARFSFMGIARKYGDSTASFFPARGDAVTDTAGM